MTDWGATNDRVEAIKAGMELEMPSSDGCNDRKIVEAVKNGVLDESDLDKTIFPDEVPPYGLKLITRDGMALSVIGPQESIYQPSSQDGKNMTKLYDILYDSDSYRFLD